MLAHFRFVVKYFAAKNSLLISIVQDYCLEMLFGSEL